MPKTSFNRFVFFPFEWKRKYFLLSSTSYLFINFWQLSSNPKCDINVSWLEKNSSNRFLLYCFFLYALPYLSFLLFQQRNLFKIIFSFFILNFSTLLDYRYQSKDKSWIAKEHFKTTRTWIQKIKRYDIKSFWKHSWESTAIEMQNEKSFISFIWKKKDWAKTEQI